MGRYFVLIPALAWTAFSAAPARAQEQSAMKDVELRDVRGAVLPLRNWASRSGLFVVTFVGVECPLSKRYAPRLAELSRDLETHGVRWLCVDANKQDSLAEIETFGRQHGLTIVKDVGNRLADLLGATRVTETFVLDRDFVIRYRGRIDDRYQIGIERRAPGRHDLLEAIQELLRGESVSIAETEPMGCFIGRVRAPEQEGKVTYASHIARIFQDRCQSCHRPGEAAPFELSGYQDAVNWAETIREVVDERRMPPWHAEGRRGQFANDPRLTDAERQAILTWIDGGTPLGHPAELPPPRSFPAGWAMEHRDVTLTIPRAFQVPADGIIDYQSFDIDPEFHEDRWLAGVEIRPGNPGVVHHATLFLMPPGSNTPVSHGSLGSFCIAAMVPGSGPTTFPKGMAKRVPAGWHFLLMVHYVSVGSPQSDRTSIGLAFADPRAVHQEVATHLLLDEQLRIPPGASNHRVERAVKLSHDLLLLAMFPHMHLRGKSFRYEADYPDGRSEMLLNVPRYDFAWQQRYILAEPMRLPAGTVLRCTAVYDNSATNARNPDPAAAVVAGPQSTDEMFNGYFDVALADEDLQVVASQSEFRYAYVAIILACGMVVARRCQTQAAWRSHLNRDFTERPPV